MGGINHQKWVIYDIAIPTLYDTPGISELYMPRLVLKDDRRPTTMVFSLNPEPTEVGIISGLKNMVGFRTYLQVRSQKWPSIMICTTGLSE